MTPIAQRVVFLPSGLAVAVAAFGLSAWWLSIPDQRSLPPRLDHRAVAPPPVEAANDDQLSVHAAVAARSAEEQRNQMEDDRDDGNDANRLHGRGQSYRGCPRVGLRDDENASPPELLPRGLDSLGPPFVLLD